MRDDDRLHRTWIAQIATGGQQAEPAFRRLHDRFQTEVLRSITHRVSVAHHGNQAQLDIAQEVWMKVWNSGAATYKGKSPVAAWLKTIAINYAKNHLKSGGVKHRFAALDDTLEPSSGKVDDTGERAEWRDCLVWAFEEMGDCCPNCEHLLRAKFVDGIDNQEQADRLGIALHAATQRLYGCRQCFRSLIQRCDDVHLAAPEGGKHG